MSNIVEMENQVSVGFDNKQVELIKNTVAKGATDDELEMFMYLATQYNLDPFKKEIWFMKYGGKTNIMTSRDGYLKYAQLNPEFEGLMSFVVKEGDEFEIDASEYKISHKFGTKRGKILGAWARCDRKGKRPFIAYVDFDEYNKKQNVWNSYPSAMIQKVAEVFVLKRAFGINGLVTKEEIDGEGTTENVYISEDEARSLFALAERDQDIVRQALDEFGFEGSLDVTKFMYEKLCKRIMQLVEDKKESDETIDEDTGEVIGGPAPQSVLDDMNGYEDYPREDPTEGVDFTGTPFEEEIGD